MRIYLDLFSQQILFEKKTGTLINHLALVFQVVIYNFLQQEKWNCRNEIQGDSDMAQTSDTQTRFSKKQFLPDFNLLNWATSIYRY